VAELQENELQLIREAGIGWLRSGISGFDPERFLRGEKQDEKFFLSRQRIAELRRQGLQIMGLTPNPRNMPPSAGPMGSTEYVDNYRRICAFLGEEFTGLIDYWQVANELDIWIFRDKLSLEQSAAFLKAGLRGLKEANPKLKVGINITLFPSLPGEVDGNTDKHEGVFIAESVYGDPKVETDYVGFDSYPGTWRRGGVDSWDEYLEALYKLTGKPIIIQEFGYSSAGEMMTPEEDASGAYPCSLRKWRFSWHGAHTPDVQAEFIAESYKTFARKPYVLGAIYYRWNDQDHCWQCKRSDCPIETAWGLVDLSGKPKPSYYSLKSTLLTCFGTR
jgi:hypothetical protein